jgi:murein L,D-transpeptidase YcbB/YkuD
MKAAAPSAFLLAACIYFAAGCGGGPATVHNHPATETQAILESRMPAEAAAGPIFCQRDRICGSDVLPLFYRGRGLRPAWIADNLDLSDAASLLLALRRVEEDGLNPESYHLAALQELMSKVSRRTGKGDPAVTAETLADLEMLLTDAFLLCGSHLVHGQVNPETIQSEWFIKGRYEDLAAVLERGLKTKDVGAALDSLKPTHVTYRNLKAALKKARAEVDSGARPDFVPGQKLKAGDKDLRVATLRAYLKVSGDLAQPGNDAVDLFDSELEQAVKRFQQRHGLEVDGVVNPETEAAMTVTPEYRLRQVRANLERWRWITSDLGDRYILVNIADFTLHVIEGESEVMSMPVVVGRPYRRTPDFSGRMTYLEINPHWNIPPRLAREDILPKVKADPGYLNAQGIHIFRDWSAGAPEINPDSIDWSQVDAEGLTFRLQQKPGPLNALGQIKFMFPNKFDVYLHDTPAKELFKKATRDFSSGCIRVAKPVDLAGYLLKGDTSWDEAKLRHAVQSGTTRTIPLRNPISVHVLYWTAWMDGNGRIHFRQDIYGRDASLYAALNQRPSDAGT